MSPSDLGDGQKDIVAHKAPGRVGLKSDQLGQFEFCRFGWSILECANNELDTRELCQRAAQPDLLKCSR
jgi:hypothetical protein